MQGNHSVAKMKHIRKQKSEEWSDAPQSKKKKHKQKQKQRCFDEV